jgi:hypothetical protein
MAPLDEVRGSDEALAVVAELIPLLDEHSRWAAVSVYALSGPDPEVLRPLLADADPGIAAYAASGLAERGDVAGLAGLVSVLAADGSLPGSVPPLPLWIFATDRLVSLTLRSDLGPPFDAEPQDVRAAAERWRSWLSANEGHLTFTAGVWRG